MAETRPLPNPVEDGWKFPSWLTLLISVVVVACIVVAFFVPPSSPEPTAADQQPASDRATQAVAEIELAMEAHANANGGHFPTGKSATEVFQKLLDEHLVKDARTFFLEMAGKTAATSNVLAPENVAFDITTPVDIATSRYVPVVFATGYRIEYKPGGRAVLLPSHPQPEICAHGGFLVAYSGAKAFLLSQGTGETLIPAQAQIGSEPYKQLTPDGPLPTP